MSGSAFPGRNLTDFCETRDCNNAGRGYLCGCAFQAIEEIGS
jgi:hypothetical protein